MWLVGSKQDLRMMTSCCSKPLSVLSGREYSGWLRCTPGRRVGQVVRNAVRVAARVPCGSASSR